VSERLYEGKTGIKNRPDFAAGSTALARFVGRGRDWSSSGENRVEIRRSAVDYFGTRRENFQFQVTQRVCYGMCQF